MLTSNQKLPSTLHSSCKDEENGEKHTMKMLNAFIDKMKAANDMHTRNNYYLIMLLWLLALLHISQTYSFLWGTNEQLNSFAFVALLFSSSSRRYRMKRTMYTMWNDILLHIFVFNYFGTIGIDRGLAFSPLDEMFLSFVGCR